MVYAVPNVMSIDSQWPCCIERVPSYARYANHHEAQLGKPRDSALRESGSVTDYPCNLLLCVVLTDLTLVDGLADPSQGFCALLQCPGKQYYDQNVYRVENLKTHVLTQANALTRDL